MNLYKNDPRVVLTLDAGGTNLVFSAMRGCERVGEAFHLPTEAHDLEKCLSNIVEGMRHISSQTDIPPVAISFAFPGPADYRNGIIGDLPNFPSFRGGVALGPYLSRKFGLPVFINNDGNLFAYGEAMYGSLPDINRRLEEAGSSKRFHNLIGVTLGTGFGAGVVVDGTLLRGDNDCGGDIWCFRNKYSPSLIVEESVSIRAVKRYYAEKSGDDRDLTPYDIFKIAEGHAEGDRKAAIYSFECLGHAAGDALAAMLTVVDGLIVIGGGIAGARKYFMPALLSELRSELSMVDGRHFPRLQMSVCDLNDENAFAGFAEGAETLLRIPGTDESVVYDSCKRSGILISDYNTSRIISAGAYIYALNHLDK